MYLKKNDMGLNYFGQFIMNLNEHLLRPIWICQLCFYYLRFIVVLLLCQIEALITYWYSLSSFLVTAIPQTTWGFGLVERHSKSLYFVGLFFFLFFFFFKLLVY